MPKTTTGATTRIVSEVNKTSLLDALRASGPMTVQQLREATGLSLATVNRIVDRLREDGLVIDGGIADSSGGRPPRLLAYNTRRRSVVAVDAGGRSIDAAIFDLGGEQLLARAVATPQLPDGSQDSGVVFERVAALTRELMDEAERMGCPVQAIGVGVPGTVRSDTGLVEFAPSVHWWDLPLASLLSERLGVPVAVENDVNLIAVGEHRLGVAQGRRNVVTIAIGTGVGAGIILNSELFRGSQGGAGEIGYLLLEPASLDQPWPGYGDLESHVSGPSMAKRALRELGIDGDGPDNFLARVRSGDPEANALFTELSNMVALAAANVSVIVNPELIVLAGGVGATVADLMIPILRTRMRGRIPLVPEIVAATVKKVELIGASQVAIDLTRNASYLTQK